MGLYKLTVLSSSSSFIITIRAKVLIYKAKDKPDRMSSPPLQQRHPAIIPNITRYTHIHNPHPHPHIPANIMGDMKEVGIFPASGALGGSTYRHLLKLVPNDHVTLINRYPEKVEAGYREAGVRVRKASYESTPQELELAFSGLDVLFLVSYPSHVHEYRVKVSSVLFTM